MSNVLALPQFKNLTKARSRRLKFPRLPPGAHQLLLMGLIYADVAIEITCAISPKMSNTESALAAGAGAAATAYLLADIMHCAAGTLRWPKSMKRTVAATMVVAAIGGAYGMNHVRENAINWERVVRGPYNPTTPDCVRASFFNRSCADQLLP